jgi:hypothetical protein
MSESVISEAERSPIGVKNGKLIGDLTASIITDSDM